MFNQQPRWHTWPYSKLEYMNTLQDINAHKKTNNVNQLICWILELWNLPGWVLRNTFYYCIKCLIQLQNSGEQCSSRWPSFLREAFTAVSCIAYSIVRNRSLYVQAWIQKLLGVNQYTEMSVGSGFCLHQYRHID